MSFPLYLNMNHFLNEATQSDFAKTEDLIRENLMSTLSPNSWLKPVQKPKTMPVTTVDDEPVKPVGSGGQPQIPVEEFGDFASDDKPKLSEGAMKRKLEKEKRDREHKERMKKLKENGAMKKPSRLQQAKGNSAFFLNAQQKKDNA